jgi:hypothetical protein
MKKLSFIVLLLATSILSCKKNNSKECQINTQAIVGNYHLTKFEQVNFTTGVAQDMTSTLSACQLSATYSLLQDSTALCTEGSGCTGSGTGKWSITEGLSFGFQFQSGDGVRLNAAMFQSWNCRELVIMTAYPSTLSNDRFTLTKF